MKDETVERLRAIMRDMRENANAFHRVSKQPKGELCGEVAAGLCLDANAILEALEALGVSELPEKLVLEEVVWKTK